MTDNDPNANHDLSVLAKWTRDFPKREASFCMTWRLAKDEEPWLEVELEIKTEAGIRYHTRADLDYGLANIAEELIAKTRPLSRPEPKLPRIVLGRRKVEAVEAKGTMGKNKRLAAMDEPRVDPCEEGEG